MVGVIYRVVLIMDYFDIGLGWLWFVWIQCYVDYSLGEYRVVLVMVQQIQGYSCYGLGDIRLWFSYYIFFRVVVFKLGYEQNICCEINLFKYNFSKIKIEIKDSLIVLFRKLF